MKKALVALGAAAALALPASPAAAQGCSVGSPNIVRDVTDCATYLVGGCTLGSPNIVRDVTDCALYVIGQVT